MTEVAPGVRLHQVAPTNRLILPTTADTIKCEAYEESRLWPQHDFSSYRRFNSQKRLNFQVISVSFNTKIGLEKLQKFALTSLDLP